MSFLPILAQASGASGGGNAILNLIPFLLIFLVMYFLIIRPQQKKMQEHQEMVAALRRGDSIVTSGGIVGKITKVVDDAEVEVEIADGVKVKVLRSAIGEVRAKANPV